MKQDEIRHLRVKANERDKILRIIRNVIGAKAGEQQDRTPAHPDNDTYSQGWKDCAGLLRHRLKKFPVESGT